VQVSLVLVTASVNELIVLILLNYLRQTSDAKPLGRPCLAQILPGQRGLTISIFDQIFFPFQFLHLL
jgi:hypothetical protein